MTYVFIINYLEQVKINPKLEILIINLLLLGHEILNNKTKIARKQ